MHLTSWILIFQLLTVPLYCDATKSQLLYKHHQIQETNASCSLASATVLINTALELQGRQPLTQQEVLNGTNNPRWTIAVQENAEGIDLIELRDYLEEALAHFEIAYRDITIHYYSEDTEDSRSRFRTLLERPNTFIIANFDYWNVIPIDEHVGHFSPVGGRRDGKFLLMDVDRSLHELEGFTNGPHWVLEDDLFQGMNTANEEETAWRGYLVLEL